MAATITVDISKVSAKLSEMASKSLSAAMQATGMVADEVLRLSSREVPHDTGLLQNSGHVDPEADGHIVGYDKVYAARLHEHPEYRFQKGRKGKYLEDPIKHNLNLFLEILGNQLQGLLA